LQAHLLTPYRVESLQVLRSMLSKRYESEFLDLNRRLLLCHQDLFLALSIQKYVENLEPARWVPIVNPPGTWYCS
jgi:hypothetical protein